MPKHKVAPIPSKRRRRKGKRGWTLVRKKKAEVAAVSAESSILKPEVPTDDFESITAQTATNLKAFRQLFGSDEDTEEEFAGYYSMEIVALKTTCKRRWKKLNQEVSYLESLLQSAQVMTFTPQENMHITSITSETHSSGHSSSSSILPSSMVAQACNDGAMANAGKQIPLPPCPSSSDLSFAGFTESDPLHQNCHTKTRKLLELCKTVELQGEGEEMQTNNPLEFAQSKHSSNVDGLNNQQESRFRNPRGSIGSAILESSTQRASMTVTEFDHPRTFAGEITVTPILQGDIPMAVKVSHSSPFLVSCLPKM